MFTQTDVILCLGRRGSGKSYLARRIQGAYPRKAIFDSLGEYSDADGFVCHTFDEFAQKLIDTENQDSFTIIFQFDVESESQSQEFNEALRCLWYRGNILVVIEEVQLHSTPYNLPHWLKQSLFIGRHRSLALLFTTQRPGECHKAIVSQANHVFCGSLHEKNDVDYVRTVLGDKAFDLVQIPERRFIYFRPGHEVVTVQNDLGLEK